MSPEERELQPLDLHLRLSGQKAQVVRRRAREMERPVTQLLRDIINAYLEGRLPLTLPLVGLVLAGLA